MMTLLLSDDQLDVDDASDLVLPLLLVEGTEEGKYNGSIDGLEEGAIERVGIFVGFRVDVNEG